MRRNKSKITVYYDGACPQCVKDRQRYESLSGNDKETICWFDITGREDRLRELGIDPVKALMELHVTDERQQVLSEVDAYALLLNRIPLFKPLAWFIRLPLIRPLLSRIYRLQVDNRLQRSGRI